MNKSKKKIKISARCRWIAFLLFKNRNFQGEFNLFLMFLDLGRFSTFGAINLQKIFYLDCRFEAKNVEIQAEHMSAKSSVFRYVGKKIISPTFRKLDEIYVFIFEFASVEKQQLYKQPALTSLT